MAMNRTVVAGFALPVLATSGLSQTMKLLPAGRVVYKCEVDKKVVYSDAPCLGAKYDSIVDAGQTGGV